MKSGQMAVICQKPFENQRKFWLHVILYKNIVQLLWKTFIGNFKFEQHLLEQNLFIISRDQSGSTEQDSNLGLSRIVIIEDCKATQPPQLVKFFNASGFQTSGIRIPAVLEFVNLFC